MSILTVVIAPNPILEKPMPLVAEINTEIKIHIQDMIDTFLDLKGYGLAANQLGIPYRMFVMNVWEDNSLTDDPDPINPELLFFVNPEIIKMSSETAFFDESCFSVPDFSISVKRPVEITLKYLDKNGVEHVREFKGLQARCIQHEIDHLNGKTVLEYASELKRSRWLKKIQKYLK